MDPKCFLWSYHLLLCPVSGTVEGVNLLLNSDSASNCAGWLLHVYSSSKSHADNAEDPEEFTLVQSVVLKDTNLTPSKGRCTFVAVV